MSGRDGHNSDSNTDRFSLSVINHYYARHECDWADNFRLRIHRSLSWLQAAQEFRQDLDAQFIFYWVAFNSAYAKELVKELDDNETEREQQKNFFINIIECDKVNDLKKVMTDLSDSIKKLINNQYVYGRFWHCQRNANDDWRPSFEQETESALTALYTGKTRKTLHITFNRLYVLRNQLMHGGSTWHSSVNRDQVHNGVNIMKKLVPLIIYIMMQNPQEDWGHVSFPYIKGRGNKQA